MSAAPEVALEPESAPLHAISVLAGIFAGNSFRICVDPTRIRDFPELPQGHTAPPTSRLPLHKDSQGMLLARKKALQFAFDPPTGIFRMSLSDKMQLDGSLQTGKFDAPYLFIRHEPDHQLYGFGAPGKGLQRGADTFSLGGTPADGAGPALPFFLIRKPGGDAIGVFLNTDRPARVTVLDSADLEWGPGTRFDFAENDPVGIDLFVMPGTPATILNAYASLTKRPDLPPLWALGYQQADEGYSAGVDAKFLSVGQRFRSEDIPCDVLYLGLANSRAPKQAPPAQITAADTESEPGARTEVPSDPAEELRKSGFVVLGHQPATGENPVQPGDPGRPFRLIRSGGAGLQQQGAVYLANNHSSWSDLRAHLHMTLNLGLSGVALSGADAGGVLASRTFLKQIKLRPDRELFARWIALASMLPLFRGNTCRFSPAQEPWAFGPEVTAAARKFMQRRYRLLPYLYRLLHQSTTTGAPMVRPVFYHFPEAGDEAVDQFMLGESLLVAPVLHKGVQQIQVQLPAGQWLEFETGHLYNGSSAYTLDVPLDYLPVFVRAGAVLPLCRGGHNTATSMGRLILELYPAAQMEGSLYLDDGITNAHRERRQYHDLRVSGRRDRSGQISLRITNQHKRFTASPSEIEVRLPSEYTQMKARAKAMVRARHEDLSVEDRRRRVSLFRATLGPGTIEFNI